VGAAVCERLSVLLLLLLPVCLPGVLAARGLLTLIHERFGAGRHWGGDVGQQCCHWSLMAPGLWLLVLRETLLSVVSI
jgi:hypothetical protein